MRRQAGMKLHLAQRSGQVWLPGQMLPTLGLLKELQLMRLPDLLTALVVFPHWYAPIGTGSS